MPLVSGAPTSKTQRYGAQARNFKHATIQSPSKGLDVSLPITEQLPGTANLLDNFLCRRMGVELRHGSLRWTTNLGGLGTITAVKSLMSYHPPRGSGSTYVAKLFAACDDMKIYDAVVRTPEDYVPIAFVTIAGQAQPGVFSHTNFSTPGDNFLVICGVGAGVWTYSHTLGWVNQTPNITGTAGQVLNFDFVMAAKNRLWFIQNNSTKAWYLPVYSIAGAAVAIDFGALFIHGGELKAMASWTLDAGDGIDDKLVLVGQNGDILIYEGTDPATAATFQIKGRWFTGRPPTGRRFLSKYAGDLSMVTESGIEYMSRLTQGSGLLDPELPQGVSPARRFNEIIGAEVRQTRNQTFWQLLSVPSQDGVVMLTPTNVPRNCHQFFYGTLAQAWSRLTGWPALCMEVFEGDLFYGTADGKINKAFAGNTDDELYDDTPGTLPLWELQSSFVPPNGDRDSLKRPGLVNVMFQGPQAPEVKLQINTEWSVKPVPGSPPITVDLASLWDVAKWNEGVWGESFATYSTWVGVEGLGKYFSLRMSVRGVPGTVFNSWAVTYEGGGIM